MNRDILLVCLFLFSVLVIMIKVHGIYIGIDSMLNDCNLLYRRTRFRATPFQIQVKYRVLYRSFEPCFSHPNATNKHPPQPYGGSQLLSCKWCRVWRFLMAFDCWKVLVNINLNRQIALICIFSFGLLLGYPIYRQEKKEENLKWLDFNDRAVWYHPLRVIIIRLTGTPYFAN